MNNDKFVIADADILISLYNPDDINHLVVTDRTQKITDSVCKIKFPNTAILEATTSLRRMANKPEIARLINQKYLNGEFNIVYVDETIQKLASEIFAQEKSKKNTIFDALVLATAKTLKAAGIFSFDSWYKKQGFKALARELVPELG
ncbi:PIN domain-containing protein [Candidatus Gottesmanbacteria bacterium]|nr:PIN domain-containing protein [Candidatus Gottesmanbacteria bacterium]